MSEISEFAKELRETRDKDRAEQREDRKDLHGKITDLGTTMTTIKLDVGEVKSKVEIVTDRVEKAERAVDRIRDKEDEAPKSRLQQANGAITDTPWKKIGGIVVGALTVIGVPSVMVGGSYSEQAEAAYEMQQRIDEQELRDYESERRAFEDEKLAHELYGAQLAAAKAQSRGAKAQASLEPLDEKAAIEASALADVTIEKIERKLAAARKKAPPKAPPRPPQAAE